MIHLMNLYREAVLLIYESIFRYVISEAKEHACHLLFSCNLVPVQPDIGTIIDPVKIQPEFPPFIWSWQIKFLPEPVRILPWIGLAVNIAEFCQVIFLVKFI